MKLPGVRQSINKKGPGHTPGSMVSVSSAGGDKEGEFVGGGDTAEASVALPQEGSAKSKNVAWDDAEKEEEPAEKVRDRVKCAVGVSLPCVRVFSPGMLA